MIADPQNSTGAGATAPAKPAKQPVIMLNESIDFATVHGDRAPGDPEAAVCYVQDGLPFNARKELIRGHHTLAEERLQKKVEKLDRKALKMLENLQKRAAEGDDDAEVDDEEDDPTADDGGAIDLKAWAAGLKKYRWQLVTDAILMTTQRRVTSKRDALELLIEQGIVQIGHLSKEHKNALTRL